MADRAALAVEEARLARAAAMGDGRAFAALYERHEQRAFNLAYRILGSQADAADAVQEAFLAAMRRLSQAGDGEVAFGFELLSAMHRACHDLMGRRHVERASETGPGLGQEEIREASLRLPERQRETLALRELEQLSYGEIATLVETNSGSVAQLISRARINLYDGLRGTALASVAPPSPECERALPLIATRDDRQLEASSPDAAWLDAHLAGCDRCRLGDEQMREAAVSYRAWAPIAAAPWLLEKTMTKVAELAGADWSEEIAEAAARAPAELPTGAPESLPGTPPPDPTTSSRSGPRRRMTLAAALAALLLLGGFALAFAGGDGSPTPVGPAAGTASGGSAGGPKSGAKPVKAGGTKGSATKKRDNEEPTTKSTAAAGPTGGETTAADALSAPLAAPAQGATGGGESSDPTSGSNRPPRKAAVQPTQQTSAPKPSSKPKPEPTPAPTPQPTASAPAPVPAPATQPLHPVEEQPDEPGRREEAPGKPTNRPPR